MRNIKGIPAIGCKGAFLKSVRINDFGKENSIVIKKASRLSNCEINIYGSNNKIIIENDCEIKKLNIWCSDGASISIRDHVHMVGNTHIAGTEGKKIEIGKKCLLASDIVIRNGDSHSILNADGVRINHAKDVYVGEHVWIGQGVTILKGTEIGNDCVVGSCSVLAGKTYANNSLIVGNPGKIVKTDIDWDPHVL